MAYLKQVWKNKRSGSPTPLIASRFNHMENGIESAHMLYEAVKHGFRIIGYAEDSSGLPDNSNLNVGDGYIVANKLHIWNGAEWLDNGYIRGPQGPRGEKGDTGKETAIGTVQMFAGNVLPEGYLWCDGAAYSREEYAELFEVINIEHGFGDAMTTFNVPNIQDLPLRSIIKAR